MRRHQTNLLAGSKVQPPKPNTAVGPNFYACFAAFERGGAGRKYAPSANPNSSVVKQFQAVFSNTIATNLHTAVMPYRIAAVHIVFAHRTNNKKRANTDAAVLAKDDPRRRDARLVQRRRRCHVSHK